MNKNSSDPLGGVGFSEGGRIEVGPDGKVKVAGTAARPRRRGWFGCLLILVIIGAAGFAAFRYLIGPFFESGGGNADTRPLPGDAASFNPITALPDVTAYAGAGAQLVSIDATYVRSDGTLDLTATSYRPFVTYKFVREVDAPKDAPPVGAAGNSGGQWYEPITIDVYQPGQWRSVSRTGGGVSLKYSYMNKGMERETDDPTSSPQTILPFPKCSFADLWKQAIQQHEAPKDAVAIIRYERDGYSFTISGISVFMRFDMDCKPVK
jgi:hypothetical protein